MLPTSPPNSKAAIISTAIQPSRISIILSLAHLGSQPTDDLCLRFFNALPERIGHAAAEIAKIVVQRTISQRWYPLTRELDRLLQFFAHVRSLTISDLTQPSSPSL